MPDQSIIDPQSASLLQTGINVAAQANINRRTQKWNEEMYARQRADNLTDWNQQNIYNSPAAQMERLKAAGLNPNLVYGKGADNTAMSINKADAKNWSPTAPQVDLTSGIQMAMNLQLAQANKNNLEKQNSVLTMEALKKEAEISNLNQGTAKSKFELALEQDLRQNSLDMRAQELKNLGMQEGTMRAQIGATEANTAYTKNQDERAFKQLKLQTISAAIQNAKTEQEKKVLEQQEILLKKDVNLRSDNINWNDPWYVRKAQEILNTEFKDFRKGGKYSSDQLIDKPIMDLFNRFKTKNPFTRKGRGF